MQEVSKQLLTVEQFHGRGERAVNQEVSARCSLIAMTRLAVNRSEEGFRARPGAHGRPAMQAIYGSPPRVRLCPSLDGGLHE